MSTIARTWVAFAAIATGLIHLALVIGAPLPLGIVLGTLGFAEFGWGVLTFARDRPPLPRVALVVAIAPVVMWGLLLVVSGLAESPGLAASLPFVPFAIASLYELFIAAVVGRSLRRPPAAESAPPSALRYTLALVGGALLVAGLTTVALAATQVADLAHQSDYDFDVPGHETGH